MAYHSRLVIIVIVTIIIILNQHLGSNYEVEDRTFIKVRCFPTSEKSSMVKNPNWANLSTPLPPWQRHPYPPPVNHADASKSSSTIHLIPASPLSQFLQQLSRYWAPFSCTPRRQTPSGGTDQTLPHARHVVSQNRLDSRLPALAALD